jgi:hypothetical protein
LINNAEVCVLEQTCFVAVKGGQITQLTVALAIPDMTTVGAQGKIDHLEQGALAAATLTDDAQDFTA